MANGFRESGVAFIGSDEDTLRLDALVAADQDDIKLRFRETLIRLMDTKRVTAAELSRKTGISKGTIDKLRQRKVDVTNAFDAMKIAMFFGMSVEQLFQLAPNQPDSAGQHHPLFGCMQGTFWIDPTYDFTDPIYTDAEMDAFADAKADRLNGVTW